MQSVRLGLNWQRDGPDADTLQADGGGPRHA
jgi:hypothetical protein